MGLFPTYIENNTAIKSEKKRKVPKDYGIDFHTGQLTGEIVEGKEAIKVWIWLALQTPRYRYYAYTWDYGIEYEELIGQGYTDEYIETEVRRMTEDCLLVHEDIQSILDFEVNRKGDILTLSFVVDTIYGTIEMEDQTVGRPEG